MSVDHLFKSFLSDAEQYKAAKEYWLLLSQEAIHADAGRPWMPWLSDTGTHDDRSATMCSLWDEAARKALCIEQMFPESLEKRIGARMDVFGLNHLDHPIDFIYIWCELSRESAAEVARLIKAWSDPKMTSVEMSKIIEGLTS